MALIVPRMPRKRSKRSFVDRLLELGAIQDRKQCRKKKQRNAKSAADGDKSNESSSQSESEASNSDSENDKAGSPPPINIKPKKNNKKDSGRKQQIKNKKPAKSVELSANEIAKLLVQAVDEGYTEALRWLAENLEEVALDQEAEGFDPAAEGTPLVPISSESIEAMDSALFLKVLKSIGVLPPVDEQESYWRIPSNLHHETIRKRREIIIKAVNKELIIDNTNTNASQNNTEPENSEERTENKAESSDDDDLFDNLRKMRDNVQDDPSSNKSKSNNKRESNKIIDSSRKRSRSIDSEEGNNRKMPRIDENEDEEDILSFAKKTLQTELPDTEDILSGLPQHSDDSEREDGASGVNAARGRRKKLRVISDDESE